MSMYQRAIGDVGNALKSQPLRNGGAKQHVSPRHNCFAYFDVLLGILVEHAVQAYFRLVDRLRWRRVYPFDLAL